MSAVRSEIYRQAASMRCALAVIGALSKNAARWTEMGRFEASEQDLASVVRPLVSKNRRKRPKLARCLGFARSEHLLRRALTAGLLQARRQLSLSRTTSLKDSKKLKTFSVF